MPSPIILLLDSFFPALESAEPISRLWPWAVLQQADPESSFML